MSDGGYQGSLQENIITLLAFDEKAGNTAAMLINPNLMDGEYRIIAERLIDYRRQYNEAPGDHFADVVDDLLSDPKNKRARGMKRVLENMQSLRGRVNGVYVIDQVETFTRMQKIRAAIVDSAEKINNQQQMAMPEIEKIWHDLLKVRNTTFTAGTRLTDYKRVLERVSLMDGEFSTGIADLDDHGVVPSRGTVFMFLAAAGRGKTWFCLQASRRALLRNQRVLHISLEMDEELVAQRYYQTMFTVPKRGGKVYTTQLRVKQNELRGLFREAVDYKFNLKQHTVELELENYIGRMGRRADNLIIKRFPGQVLTGGMLRAYLDMLDSTENFQPDMIIIDYPRLMRMDSRIDLRIAMDNTIIDLRALAVERNCAVIAPHQASKEGEQSNQIKNTHMSEAWALAGTVDTLVTYSCSDMEFNFGLGRLFTAKSRYERDRFSTLITQNYNLGVFAVDSFPMIGAGYGEMFKEFAAGERMAGREDAFTPTHADEDVDD